MKSSKGQPFQTSFNWKIIRPKSVSGNKFSISKTFSLKKRVVTLQNDNKSVNDGKAFDFEMDQSKISALKSIYKGIKLNEVGYITGFRSKKLRTQPVFQDDLIHQSAHDTLIQIRKRFDSVSQKKNKIDANIKKLNLQIQKYQREIQAYNLRKESGQAALNKRDQLNQDAEITFISLQDQKRVYKHVKDRLRQDKDFYYQKKFILSKQLEYLNKQLKILRNQGRQVNQSMDRASKFFEKLKQQMDQQNFQRQEHLVNLQSIIDMKQKTINNDFQRNMQMTGIAYKAVVEKDNTEKQWKKVYFTHRLVAEILSNKIETEMQKFQLVENAFLQIKTQTEITQGKQIVTRFFNKDKIYGQLLGKIAQNDVKLQNLNRDHQLLSKQLKENQLLSVKFDKGKKIDEGGQGQTQLNFYKEKLKKIATIKSKMKQWLQRQNKKLSHLNQHQSRKVNIGSDREMFEHLKKFLINLRSQLQQAQKEEVSAKQRENEDKDELPRNEQFRVTRIKLDLVRKQSLNSSKLFQKEDNQQQSFVNANEQLEVINAHRQLIVKKNQKFLKEVHKKMIQHKKMMMDKQSQAQKKK